MKINKNLPPFVKKIMTIALLIYVRGGNYTSLFEPEAELGGSRGAVAPPGSAKKIVGWLLNFSKKNSKSCISFYFFGRKGSSLKS